MTKIIMKKTLLFEEAFSRFIVSKKCEGLAEKTIRSYEGHLRCMGKYLDIQMPMSSFQKEQVDEMIQKMQSANLSANSIASYVRTLKSFLSWCNEEGISDVKIPKYKTEETVKEVYTDEELIKLLRKPNLQKCAFTEYRDWVIINFLISTGCRAATLRAIQVRDIDFENHFVYYRHTKNGKAQIMPLCTQMQSILKEYLYFREGEETDPLFCTEDGEALSENAVKLAVARYNKRRGVSKTSTHLFRHTFATKYLLDCGGDAFTLQRLLGHSTLEMTKHYCRISNKDIAASFNNISPLEQLKPASKKIRIK